MNNNKFLKINSFFYV